MFCACKIYILKQMKKPKPSITLSVIKHSSHLRTLVGRVFYISLVFTNDHRVLSQCNTRLRHLYLLNNRSVQRVCSGTPYIWCLRPQYEPKRSQANEQVNNDHRSAFSNLSNWKEEAWKNQGFNGIRTHDLHDTGAMLYQLCMKPHIGSVVNLLSSCLPWGVKWCEVYVK